MKHAALLPALGLAAALGFALLVTGRGEGQGGGATPSSTGSASSAGLVPGPAVPHGSSRPARKAAAAPSPLAPARGASPTLEALLTDAGVHEDDGGAPPASELRLRLVRAIRGTYSTDEARQQAMREALSSSGARAEWDAPASATFAAWGQGLEGDGRLEADTVRCYEAGCEVRVVFPDRAAFDRAAARFRALREDAPWHGGRVQTPPAPGEGGSLGAYWMLLAPEQGG